MGWVVFGCCVYVYLNHYMITASQWAALCDSVDEGLIVSEDPVNAGWVVCAPRTRGEVHKLVQISFDDGLLEVVWVLALIIACCFIV